MTDHLESGQQALALELIRHAVHKDILTYADMEPLLQRLLPRTTQTVHSPYALFCLLHENGDAQALALAQRIHAVILKDAVRAAQLRRDDPSHDWSSIPTLAHLPSDIPAGLRNDTPLLPALRRAVLLERDRAFLLSLAPDLTIALRAVTDACVGQREQLRGQPACWTLLSRAGLWHGFVPPQGTTLPPATTLDSRADDDARLAELAKRVLASSGLEAADALKQLVSWPDASFAPFILKACVTPASQAFAMHALALRTGAQYASWWEWDGWLKRATAADVQLRSASAELAKEFSDELRMIWLQQQPGTLEPALEKVVFAAVAERARRSVSAAEFIQRWDHVLTPAEASRLTGGSVSAHPDFSQQTAQIQPLPQDPLPILPLSQAVADIQPMLPSQPPPLPKPPPLPTPPPLPAAALRAWQPEKLERKTAAPTFETERVQTEASAPSVWDEHIRPFLAANWYIIAGLLMVVTGASLLAYFTWDKSVFVRYLFLPLLLGGFTGGMAELGLRLSRRHENLRASGTFLLGGAVCLLPVNFMVLCRAGDDPQAAALVLPALALYAALAGLGLWRWCGAVRSELRVLLGLPLLAVNLLAVLGDMPGLRATAALHRTMLVPATITAAVLLLLAVSNRFLRLVLTKELLESKLVPWFFGITMAATLAQVSVWRHFHLHLVPRPQDYALAAILVGATLLRWERRACELRNTGAAYGGESFLGYAALLLGILMAAGNEWLRIVALLLVGIIWLVQAPRRPGVVHYWIGSTLFLLGGAAVGLLSVFPKSSELNLLPVLGIALALVAGGARALAGRSGETRLREVALEIQPPILLLSAIVAVLSQYNLRSAPWQTGLVLLAGSLFFAFRATRENRRDWLNIAAAGAGLALPYLGCADMTHYRFDGNSLALGFGLLAGGWLATARLLPGVLWRQSSSFIATCFGGAGILGLCLRLILANRPVITGAELVGGALLTLALGVAAWQSRSRVPGLMASGLLAVLLPLFRVPANALPEWLHLGTGLTSAFTALALILGCFDLRRRAAAAPQTAPESSQTTVSVFIVPMLAALFWLSGKALLRQFQPHPSSAPFIVSIILLSATFYAAAIYFRKHLAGKFLFHASWPLLGAGLAMACKEAGCTGVEMFQYPLLWTGIALSMLLAVEWTLARRLEWLKTFLVRPRLQLLAYGSVLVAGFVILRLQLSIHDSRSGIQWLALFLAAQLVWHGLRSSLRRFGAVLFALTAAWLCTARHLPASFADLPVFLLATLIVDLALEFLPTPRAVLRPLRAPFVAGTTLLATALVAVAVFTLRSIGGETLDFAQPRPELLAILAALLLAARAQAFAGFMLPAVALGYLLCLLPCGVDELVRPWRLAEVALSLCLVPFLGNALTTRWPRLLRGPAPQMPGAADTPQAPWFLVPGLVLAASAAAAQVAIFTMGWADDARWVQIAAPFAAVFAFSFSGLYWRKGALWAVAACLLPVANLFAVSVLWGRILLEAQLTPVHIAGLAAVLTIAEYATARWLLLKTRAQPAPFVEAAKHLHLGCTALAGLTLMLLGLNYLANPDLAQIPTVRFYTSGLLALAAGVYFRFAARRPENLPTQEGVWLESLWHVALGIALWCGALLLPALRTPHAALYALALPAAACWVAAEWFVNIKRKTEENNLTGTRFRVSATAFAVLILVLYVFRLPFQLLLFPNAPLELDRYLTGAAAAVFMGLILIRVRGLGGAPWAALLGGLALMAGLYFNVTWLPGLSPFSFPMASAWAAVVAAHLLILLSFQQSPLRSLIQHIGGIGAEEWHAHRRLWGLYLTAAVHVAVVAGLLQDYRAHSLETTPLLAALATVLIHQAVIGAPWARAYWGLVVFELLVALHFDFLLPVDARGLIPARQVVWFVLVPWLGATFFCSRFKGRIDCSLIGVAAAGLAVLCAGHLFYHGPATGSGVLIAALMILAASLTPLSEDALSARPVAALMLVAPLWLAYFGTRWFAGDHATGFRPLLAGAATLIGSGMFVRLAGKAGALPSTSHRLVHAILALCRRDGEIVTRGLLAGAFVGLALLTHLHGDARHGGLGLMLALAFVWAVSGVAWFREGRFRDGILPYALSVLSLAGAWIILRRLLFQHFNFWTYEYDIWLSLGASVAFSAAKRLVKHERPGLGRTMTGTVWLLPVFQCVWLLSNRMSADLTLLVIGIQSMLFAWQGGGRRDSPYNAVSVLGFVAFVCLLFWAKLDLRYVQAYTIPSGLGVLGLVWLFGKHMKPTLRNAVRLTTVLIMLGSCGYYALLDNSYPVGFHLAMIVLSLAVMALGPLLRVQLYLFLGFAGFATDLIALVAKQFRVTDRTTQMVGVGALLLLLGIVVVGGAIAYKTHHALIKTRFGKIRARLGGWE